MADAVMPTLQDLVNEIAEVRTAMSACRTAMQNYAKPGFSAARVSYPALAAHLKDLLCMHEKMSGGGIIAVTDKSGGLGPYSTQDSSFTDPLAP